MWGRVGCSQDVQDEGHLVPAIPCRLSVLRINIFCSHYYGLFPQSLFPLIELEMSHMKFIISSLALLGTTAYIFASIQIHKTNHRSEPLFFLSHCQSLHTSFHFSPVFLPIVTVALWQQGKSKSGRVGSCRSQFTSRAENFLWF